jgi:predicted ATPase
VEAFKEECRYLVTQCEEAQGKQRCKYRAKVKTVSSAEKQTRLCEKFLTCIIQNVTKMSAQTSGVGSLHQNKENLI